MFLRVAIWLLLGPGAGAVPAADTIHLVVLHTNDLHGQLLPRPATWLGRDDPPLAGGLPRVAAAIARERARLEQEGAAVLVLDAGDWFMGTPEGQLEDGRPFLGALAATGYDALCIGNHDLDLGLERLEELLASTRLPALCANATRDSQGRVPIRGARPWARFERAGLSILVVGLITPATRVITHADARSMAFVEPAEALARALEEVRADGTAVDLVIPLTHLGLDDDRELARALPELELIVGGHSHSFLPEGANEGRALIVQVGSRASAVGRVDLWIDAESRAVTGKRARALDLAQESEPAARVSAVERICRSILAESGAAMERVVGELAAPATRARSGFSSSSAGNWIADCMRARTGADLAVHNRGGLRADVEAGPVTRRALFELSPFANHLETLELQGRELLAMLEHAVDGRGSPGLDLSGAEVDVRLEGGRAKLVAVRVAGRELAADERYRLTTNSYLARGGDGYAMLAQAERRESDAILLRELTEACLGKVAGTPPTENRYRVLR